MKKLATLLLLAGLTLSLRAQDAPHRLVEIGVDARGSFANSYLRIGDILKETITLDISQMADDLGDGLELFLDAHAKTFINVNLGAFWGFGFFAGVDTLGQLKIPQSMIELLAEGNDPNKTYSDKMGLGGAAFFEAGFRASAKIRRITFTVRPAYFLPLAYLSNPRVNYNLALNDDGSFSIEGKYNVDMYTFFSQDTSRQDSSGNVSIEMPNRLDSADLFGKGGADLVLRAEYPLRHNLIIGGSLGHIPLAPARLTDKYSMTGGFELNKTIEDILSNDFEMPDLEVINEYDGTSEKLVFRPFKIGVDAVYRPLNIRLVTLRPELALVFNSIYNTPAYLDFGISAELNLADIFTVSAGTHLEDLIWKERIGLALNLRAFELIVGITTQSQQFFKSFQGAGFGLDAGIRIGY
ncbi:MAG: hypothetical protein LBG14_07205 [Treponema sp.]|jgi:hypothetical protein|nr:hypothetical protein [Treponema sp.]